MSAITDEVVVNVWGELLSTRGIERSHVRAVLEAAAACGVVPNADQVIVPREPTDAILDAALDAEMSDLNAGREYEVCRRIWSAMLKAAAPKAEGE